MITTFGVDSGLWTKNAILLRVIIALGVWHINVFFSDDESVCFVLFLPSLCVL